MVGVVGQTNQFALSAKALGKRMRTPHAIIVTLAMVAMASFLVLLFIIALSRGPSQLQQSSTQVQYESSTVTESPSAPDPVKSLKAPSTSSSANKTETTSTIQTDLSVNGKSVPLPKDGNGSVHKVITSNRGGKTSVDIEVKTKSSSSTSSNLELNVESNQSSTYNSE